MLKNNSFSFIIITFSLSIMSVFFGGIELYSFVPIVLLNTIATILLFAPFTSSKIASENISNIFKSPYFLIFLIIVILVLLQLSNPSCAYEKSDSLWFFNKIDYNQYLPSCIIADEKKGSIHSLFLVLLGAIFLQMTLLSTLSNSHRIFTLFKFIFITAIISIVVFIYQQLSMDMIYSWTNPHFNSSLSFYYHPHGNSFLLCISAIGWSLMIKNANKKIKIIFYSLCQFLIMLSIFLSKGTGGTLLALVYFPIMFFYFLFCIERKYTKYIIYVILSILLLTSTFLATSQQARNYVESRYSIICKKFSDKDYAIRSTPKSISWNMIKTTGNYNSDKVDIIKLIFGNGLNSYRSKCEIFSINSSTLTRYKYNGKMIYFVTGFAHCDPLQIIFELGIFTTLLLLLWIFKFSYEIYQYRKSDTIILSMPLVITIFIIIAYSFNDNIFYNAFVSYIIILLSVASIKLLKLQKDDKFTTT